MHVFCKGSNHDISLSVEVRHINMGDEKLAQNLIETNYPEMRCVPQQSSNLLRIQLILISYNKTRMTIMFAQNKFEFARYQTHHQQKYKCCKQRQRYDTGLPMDLRTRVAVTKTILCPSNKTECTKEYIHTRENLSIIPMVNRKPTYTHTYPAATYTQVNLARN